MSIGITLTNVVKAESKVVSIEGTYMLYIDIETFSGDKGTVYLHIDSDLSRVSSENVGSLVSPKGNNND